jgi:hypothetical protein
VTEQQVPAKIGVHADSKGLLVPKTIDEAYRLAVAFCKSGMVPARFKSPEAVMTAMQYGIELGLKPLTAIRQIAVIHGNPCIYGDLPLSLCYGSGKLESIQEFLIDTKGKPITLENLNTLPFGAVCRLKRKGDIAPIERIFTFEDAKRAGLVNNPTWKQYPQRMLTCRARSMALKDKFPDTLNGVAIAEYDYHVLPDEAEDGEVEVQSEAASVNEKHQAAMKQSSTEIDTPQVEN